MLGFSGVIQEQVALEELLGKNDSQGFYFIKYSLLLFRPGEGTMRSHPGTRLDSRQGKLMCQVRRAETKEQ